MTAVGAQRDGGCVFCDIVTGDAPAEIIRRWDDAIAFRPLNPVVPGHVLVVPTLHVADARVSPESTADTFRRAAMLAAAMVGADVNLITSAGSEATQTVMHLHVHVRAGLAALRHRLPVDGHDQGAVDGALVLASDGRARPGQRQPIPGAPRHHSGASGTTTLTGCGRGGRR